MANRASQTILLCEDDPQERLVRTYLKACGLDTVPPSFVPRNASREVHGGNVDWVRREFPKELRACRHRHAAKAETLLIVVVDADKFEVGERRGHLLADPADSPVASKDPLVILIPRRHIETWIRAATGKKVNETDDYKNPEPAKSEIRAAARTIYDWARDQPKPGPTCVPSLHTSFPEWRRVG